MFGLVWQAFQWRTVLFYCDIYFCSKLFICYMTYAEVELIFSCLQPILDAFLTGLE